MQRRIWMRPEALLVVTFAGMIVLGTLCLYSPLAQRGEPISLLDAFFTATSAVCVTGLTTVDTGGSYNGFGRFVVFLMIQLGGLGVMTFGAIAIEMLGRRMSFTSQAALQDVFFQASARGDVRTALRRIVGMTLAFEAIGAVFLYVGMRGADGVQAGLFNAIFHSVSAFCNAGFSLYQDNLTPFKQSRVVVWTIMLLVVAGGLGYTVLIEIGRRLSRLRKRGRRGSVHWTLNTRVVMAVSALLIVGGTLTLLATGTGAGESSIAASLTDALFQSVSARTAGFNMVNVGALPLPALMILIALMFVGGSPGSCAGGIKTTSLAVWIARILARLTGREQVHMLGRRIPHDVVRRAALVIAVAAIWNAVGIMVLSITEGTRADVRFEHIIFEQVSAFATVGLSAGLTPELSVAGKLWIIASMFVGRLGPLTVALAVMTHARARFEYPQERVMIG